MANKIIHRYSIQHWVSRFVNLGNLDKIKKYWILMIYQHEVSLVGKALWQKIQHARQNTQQIELL
jgi:hypothetical protein